MAECWLVTVDKSLREIALLKIIGGNAEVIAGDKAALRGFKEGKPDTLAMPLWQFQLITCHAWFPAVGESIDRLGPVVDSAAKLNKERERRRLKQRGQNLSTEEVVSIRNLLANGMSQRNIAAKHRVSRAFVQRLNSSDPPTL